MWFVTDPEELRNYRYSSSLKKAKADLVRRYEGLDGSGPYGLWPVLRDSLWYTGISSDPVSSLAAHGVDVSQTDRFVCWVIPVKFARELKAQALSLDQFQHADDDASDYIAPELPYTYLYNFLVEKGSVLSICPDGFSPMKYLPGRPAQVFVWRGDGSRVSWDIPTKDRDSYPEVLGDLLEKARAGEVVRLLLRCQGATIVQCDFREGGWDLYFDARTSQSGYVYRYLPEEGQEGDWEALHDILLDFLRSYKKKRGTKWRYLRKALASDDMRFENGMICHQ